MSDGGDGGVYGAERLLAWALETGPRLPVLPAVLAACGLLFVVVGARLIRGHGALSTEFRPEIRGHVAALLVGIVLACDLVLIVAR